jgi:hypothetical protein
LPAAYGVETWTLKLAQQFCGLKTGSEPQENQRGGSPHGLVCRKNSASDERRAAQRRQELADIATLRGANRER